jgi:hypothetical protein
MVAVHRHSSEEGSEEIVKLLVFEIFSSCVSLPLVLRARTILLCSKTVVVSFLLSIDEHRVSI